MSDEERPPDEADLKEVNLSLSQGLQACRSVVASYRTLLSTARAEVPGNDNDPGDGGESYPEAR